MGRNRTVTQAHLARNAGVTRQAIHKNPHIKKTADGSVDVNATATTLGALERAQLRKEEALAELRELELQEKQGLLVDAAHVREEGFKAGRIIREGLQAIPDRVTALVVAQFGVTELSAAKVHALLTEEIRKALTAVSDGVLECGESGPAAGSAPDGISVGGRESEAVAESGGGAGAVAD